LFLHQPLTHLNYQNYYITSAKINQHFFDKKNNIWYNVRIKQIDKKQKGEKT